MLHRIVINVGANLWGDVSPPIIRLRLPNIFMPHICELHDLFFSFGLHFTLGKKSGIWELMTFFLVFTSLHFTVVDKNLGNRAGVSNLRNHPPNFEKWHKMVKFAESSPPMLNMDLRPW